MGFPVPFYVKRQNGLSWMSEKSGLVRITITSFLLKKQSLAKKKAAQTGGISFGKRSGEIRMCNRTPRRGVHRPVQILVDFPICAVLRKAQMQTNHFHLRRKKIAVLTKAAIFFLVTYYHCGIMRENPGCIWPVMGNLRQAACPYCWTRINEQIYKS